MPSSLSVTGKFPSCPQWQSSPSARRLDKAESLSWTVPLPPWKLPFLSPWPAFPYLLDGPSAQPRDLLTGHICFQRGNNRPCADADVNQECLMPSFLYLFLDDLEGFLPFIQHSTITIDMLYPPFRFPNSLPSALCPMRYLQAEFRPPCLYLFDHVCIHFNRNRFFLPFKRYGGIHDDPGGDIPLLDGKRRI